MILWFVLFGVFGWFWVFCDFAVLLFSGFVVCGLPVVLFGYFLWLWALVFLWVVQCLEIVFSWLLTAICFDLFCVICIDDGFCGCLVRFCGCFMCFVGVRRF